MINYLIFLFETGEKRCFLGEFLAELFTNSNGRLLFFIKVGDTCREASKSLYLGGELQESS